MLRWISTQRPHTSLYKKIKFSLIDQFVKKFREEEIEHKDIALEHNAEDIKGYQLMTKGIKNITKLAIFLSKKI